jgi:hypothetical protein
MKLFLSDNFLTAHSCGAQNIVVNSFINYATCSFISSGLSPSINSEMNLISRVQLRNTKLKFSKRASQIILKLYN